MKIYHAADIHLGRRRLDGRLPDEDIAQSFRFIVEEAVHEKADVFLLAGDLFDKPQVEPRHLRQAQEILVLLRNAGIPVIAIEGNHDKQFVNSDAATWVGYLADDGLLKLLRPEFNAGGAILKEWDATTRNGSWLDVHDVRFVGAGYLGAATPNKVRQMLAKMETGKPQVLLLHAGPEYFVGEGGGFSKEELNLLKEKVTYLALGHIHKPMVFGSWACNPGSPENCDLRESDYSTDRNGKTIGRGYAVVELDPADPSKPASLIVKSNPRRPVCRVELDCSPFGSRTKNGEEALMNAALKAAKQATPLKEAVVEIFLTGMLNLNRIVLDQTQAAREIASQAGVFAVSFDTSLLNLKAGITGGGSESTAQLSRDQLERNAILQLVNEHPIWGLQEEQQSFSSLFYDLKESVRNGKSAEELASLIATSPLLEKVKVALNTAASKAQPITEDSTTQSQEVL